MKPPTAPDPASIRQTPPEDFKGDPALMAGPQSMQYPKKTVTPDTNDLIRIVEVTELSICEVNGYVQSVKRTGKFEAQIRCKFCGDWTWLDGNFGCMCEQALQKRES